jgi:hypothetical protein
MITRIALLLMFISALVASVPSAAQSAALLAGATKKDAMETGAQAVIADLPLVAMDFAMNGQRQRTSVDRSASAAAPDYHATNVHDLITFPTFLNGSFPLNACPGVVVKRTNRRPHLLSGMPTHDAVVGLGHEFSELHAEDVADATHAKSNFPRRMS